MSVFKIAGVGGATALFVVILTACVQLGAAEEEVQLELEPAATMADFVQCSMPRPEICYELYQPVCATRDNGMRCITTPCPATELATYSNDCKACADKKVMGFVSGGACKGAELSVDLLRDVGA